MELKRLFDCIEHQLTHFPKTDMLAAKIDGSWQPLSTTYVQEKVNALSAGLLRSGFGGNDMTVEGADKIAIISNNRPEWIFADLAVQQIGAILVPVYPTTNPIELEFILKDSAAKAIFVSSKDLVSKVQDLLERLPSLQQIYTFDDVEGVPRWTRLLTTDVTY
ncbi:MAG TPA: AMP-binding protein, partial [Segetibacter sp.]